MLGNSPKLNETRENQECQLPDGKILDLFNSIDPKHQDAFKEYVLKKLKCDPWAQEVIEDRITTREVIGTIINNDQKRAEKVTEAVRKYAGKPAANDENFDQLAA